MTDVALMAIDSATKLEARHRDAVVVCGSHGGTYCAYLAARVGLRAVILCDAGVGKDRAGLGCLAYCAALGMAAATVAHDSARIGDCHDILARGRISHANEVAASVGVAAGQAVAETQSRLAAAPRWQAEPPAYREARRVVLNEPGRPRVICMDSASLVEPGDAGQIVVTGSHGALLGGCGIVMPISAIDDCTPTHWEEVRAIVESAAESAGFRPNLVSNELDVGIIQDRIIKNLYSNPIVVCDVSAKNPNVMFELGMRLAFDKPTIIIKDDRTTYSFDTGIIEHLDYPRDLRFHSVINFQNTLVERIKATYAKATEGGDYTTFLKHFGEFRVAKVDTKEVTGQELLLEEIRLMRAMMEKVLLPRRITSEALPFPNELVSELLVKVGEQGATERVEQRRLALAKLKEKHRLALAERRSIAEPNKVDS